MNSLLIITNMENMWKNMEVHMTEGHDKLDHHRFLSYGSIQPRPDAGRFSSHDDGHAVVCYGGS